MNPAWFIDALDARGGLAFASHRLPDLQSEAMDMEAPSIHLAAPHFSPEPMSSRTTALAAARGAFQLGLYLGDAEIAFDDLEDLTEFVRRAFAASGGSDGPNGFGDVPPPAPPTDDGGEDRKPDPEPPSPAPEARAGCVRDMMMMIVDAAKRATPAKPLRVSDEALAKMIVSEPIDLASAGDAAAGSLERAALALGCELVRRAPTSESGLTTWLEAITSLSSAAFRMNLGSRIDSDGLHALAAAGRHVSDGRLRLLFDASELPHQTPPFGLSDERAAALAAMVMTCTFQERPYPAHASTRPLRMHWGAYAYAWCQPRVDPFRCLTRWPVPADSARRLGLDVYRSSLADLLCVMTAAPLASKAAQIDMDLLLFAAVHIATDRNVFTPRFLRSSLRRHRQASQIGAGAAWLRRQFPSRVFPEELEALLFASASLRYR